MKCPKCGIKLNLMEREGHIGFCCAQCSGIFLTGLYISTLQFKQENSVFLFYKKLDAGITKDSRCKCPSCEKQMPVTIYRNTELDFCYHCKSIWFDYNELCSTITAHRSPHVGEKEYSKTEIFSYIVEFIGGIFTNLH